MKQKTRSAAALVGMTVLTGGGIAAAVTGLGQPAAPATSTAAPAASDAALAAAVHELLDRSQALHTRLVSTRHALRALDRRLHQQRALATQLATAPVQVPPAPAAPARLSAGAPPAVHTTTRASAAAGHGDDVEGGDD